MAIPYRLEGERCRFLEEVFDDELPRQVDEVLDPIIHSLSESWLWDTEIWF
jgi:hypothetical protein